MVNKIFKSLLVILLSWTVIWVAIWIVFIDFLPSHAHFEYMGLVSPLLLLILPFYGSAITGDAYQLVIIPGVIFWTVIIALIYLKKTRGYIKDKIYYSC